MKILQSIQFYICGGVILTFEMIEPYILEKKKQIMMRKMKQNCMKLKYDRPAPVIDDFLHYSTPECAWEKYSLPLGNGFFGANVFGRLGTERVQISDPSLANPYYVPKTIPRRRSCAS